MAAETPILRRPRPMCCFDGWAGACGGTCDWASAQQEAAEQREWEAGR